MGLDDHDLDGLGWNDRYPVLAPDLRARVGEVLMRELSERLTEVAAAHFPPHLRAIVARMPQSYQELWVEMYERPDRKPVNTGAMIFATAIGDVLAKYHGITAYAAPDSRDLCICHHYFWVVKNPHIAPRLAEACPGRPVLPSLDAILALVGDAPAGGKPVET